MELTGEQAECPICGYDPSAFWGCACTMDAAQARVDRREPRPVSHRSDLRED